MDASPFPSATCPSESVLPIRLRPLPEEAVRDYLLEEAGAPADEDARDKLAVHFRELGLQAPPPDEVAAAAGVDRQTARKLIQLLIREQVLVKVNDSLVVDRGAMQKLIDDVRGRKSVSPTFGVGAFKELTGLSRKFAVPLLEYLDGQRVTRRVGDERLIL